jgi:gliding motility-associated-like protein
MKYLSALFLIFLSLLSVAQPNDCPDAVPGCTTPSFAIAPNNPSTNIVDFTSGSISNPSTNPNSSPGNAGCLLSGETSSTFITISVVSNGTLAWSIIGPSGGCFDWIMWPYNGSSTCAAITGNTLPPVACNWNGTCNGNTGMAPPGQLPPSGSPSSYENPLNVTAGQQYLLCLSNYSGTSQNVNLNFFGTANVACGVSAPDQTICVGGTALVTIATPGVNAPQFTWLVTDGVSNTSSGSNVSVTPSQTTTYEVEVYQPATSTSSEFVDTAVFTIYIEQPPQPNAGQDNAYCFGQLINLDGTASDPGNTLQWTYLASGITPAPAVNFAPSSSASDPFVSVNQNGTYQFILTETSAACGPNRDTVVVTVSSVQQTLSFVPPSCGGQSDGTITVSSATGVDFSIDGGTSWQASPLFSGISAGNYTVCTRNALGCVQCGPLVVTEPSQLAITVSNDTTICQNGIAQLNAFTAGGNAVSYHWDHTTSLLAEQSVQPTTTTTYSVYSSNQSGCTSPTETITVTVLDPISGTISPETYVCPGYETTVGATASGGIGAPYTFVWSNGANDSGTLDSTDVSPPQTMTYSVTISDGCESTPLVLDVLVEVAPLPVPAVEVVDSGECEPASFALNMTTDPSTVQSIVWNISNGETYNDLTSIVTGEMSAGSYDVQIILTSPEGCIDSTTYMGYLTSYPKPVADFMHSPNPAYLYDPTVYLYNYSTFGDTYQWYIESGNPEFSTSENPITTFPEGEAGEYQVTLITTSEYGCMDTVIKPVLVVQDVVLFVPNTFTPDGDEYNQNFQVHIDGIDIFSFNMLIFNRWGEIIWENNNPSESWDGSYNGQIVPVGTYTWKIVAKDRINDDQYLWHGHLNVIR